MNGPYVRRMIPEPGDADREVPVLETFHEQTDDELTVAEIKQMEADDQAIQTILLGLPEDIYAAVDSWFTSTEGNRLSLYFTFSKLMNDFKRNKHFPEKIASNLKFLNNLQPEWSRHVTIVHQTKDLHTTDYTQLYDFLKYNQKEVDDQRVTPTCKLQSNTITTTITLTFINHNYMQQANAKSQRITDPRPPMNMALVLYGLGIQLKLLKPQPTTTREFHQKPSYSADCSKSRYRMSGNQVVSRFSSESGWSMLGTQNGKLFVPGLTNQNPNGNGNVVAARAEGNATGIMEEARIQLQAEEFDLMAAAGDLDEIKEVNANYILMANLQGHAKEETSKILHSIFEEAAKFVRDFKSLAKEADESLAKHKTLELEIERLLRAVVSQDIMSIVQNPSVVDSSNLQTELDRIFRINPFKPSREEKYVPNKVRASVRINPITVSQPHVIIKKDINSDSNGLSSTGVHNTAKTRRPQPRSNTKNDRPPSASKSSCSKNKEVEVEEHPRNLLLSKNNKHMSSECNNVKLAIRNDKSEVVYAMCNQFLITANHDVCVLNYVNDMNSRDKKQKANVSNTKNQKKQKPKVMKPKKVGSNKRLASPKPSKPRSCLRWSPTGRLFDLKGKIIASSESDSQSDCSNGDNACTANPLEPTIKWFPNSTSFLGRNLKLLINFVWKFLGTVRFGNDHVAAILGFDDLQ
ncbi:hypothetical protein Tco_0528497 [Tanacetum coccineum]